MLQLTAQSRIFLAVQPIDFRKGIEGLGDHGLPTRHVACHRDVGRGPIAAGVDAVPPRPSGGPPEPIDHVIDG